MRRILLLGATSPVGIQVARETLCAFRTCPLILLVQDATKLPTDLASHRDVIVVTGALEDPDTMLRVMEGASVVLAVLGPEGPTKREQEIVPDDIIVVFRNITAAMREHGVRRIIFTGPVTLRVNEDGFNLAIATVSKLLLVFLVRESHKEWTKFGKWLADEMLDLDWTLVRNGFLKDGGSAVEAGYITPERGTGVTRAGVAAFIIQQLTAPSAWIQKAPYLTSV